MLRELGPDIIQIPLKTKSPVTNERVYKRRLGGVIVPNQSAFENELLQSAETVYDIILNTGPLPTSRLVSDEFLCHYTTDPLLPLPTRRSPIWCSSPPDRNPTPATSQPLVADQTALPLTCVIGEAKTPRSGLVSGSSVKKDPEERSTRSKRDKQSHTSTTSYWRGLTSVLRKGCSVLNLISCFSSGLVRSCQ
jgi:hypothetical protein